MFFQETVTEIYQPFLKLTKIINKFPTGVKLPASMIIYPTFHMSHIKPVTSSPQDTNKEDSESFLISPLLFNRDSSSVPVEKSSTCATCLQCTHPLFIIKTVNLLLDRPLGLW